MEEALEAASLHPAQLLGISQHKGTLSYGADAGKEFNVDGYFFSMYLVVWSCPSSLTAV